MRSNHFPLIAGLLCVVLMLLPPTRAEAQTRDAALTGVVTSARDGALEGVLVSARKNSSTMTVTVVSDAQGRYAFPAAKLEPGRYSLRIRAVGYDLDGAEAVDIWPNKRPRSILSFARPKISPPNSRMGNGSRACRAPMRRKRRC